jgi:hypothetical protein
VSYAGDRIHDALETDDFSKLEGEELSMAIRCREQLNMLRELVFTEDDDLTVHKEERMWYNGNRYSGKPDVVFLHADTALIVDYKTGRNCVGDASENDQLQWLAVLAHHTYKVNTVIVAVVQPHCGEPTFHKFNPTAMKRIRNKVLRILRAVEKPGAKLRPGKDQCRYCKAKHVCPALKNSMSEIALVDPEALTPTKTAEILEQAQAVKELIKAVEERAEAMMAEDPGAIPGWTMKPGSVRRSVEDSKGTYGKLADGGYSFDLIINSASFSLSKLERAIRENDSDKDARGTVRELLGDLIKEKRTKSKLEKIGG